MPVFTVTLARLVRETKTVEVEANSIEEIDVEAEYEKDEGEGWEPDMEWGCEEGTHTVTPKG